MAAVDEVTIDGDGYYSLVVRQKIKAARQNCCGWRGLGICLGRKWPHSIGKTVGTVDRDALFDFTCSIDNAGQQALLIRGVQVTIIATEPFLASAKKLVKGTCHLHPPGAKLDEKQGNTSSVHGRWCFSASNKWLPSQCAEESKNGGMDA